MRIACIGGAHWDTKAHLLEPPALGSSNPARVTRSPGGVACNVARNLVKLGLPATLCSLAGQDEAGHSLQARLGEEGIDTAGLVLSGSAATAGYTAVLDPDGGLVMGIADMAAYDGIDDIWVSGATATAAEADLWVIDANLPAAAIESLIERAPAPVFADPVSTAKAPRLQSVLGRIDMVFPERREAEVLTGKAGDARSLALAIAATGTAAVVTAGPEGAVVARGSEAGSYPALEPSRIVDVTGAGDALLAGYVHGLATDVPDPLRWGMAAASLTVETAESVSPAMSVQALEERAASA